MPKCKGCSNEAVTSKGWCCGDCYLKNQKTNKGWFEKGHSPYDNENWYEASKIAQVKWRKDNPKLARETIEKMNTPEANKKKGHKGEKHHGWIKDRSKLKPCRNQYEEKWFMREVLKERNYICELTGTIGGRLSVHHLDSVHLFPEKKFDKNNVIVIMQEFHKKFHNSYGYQWATKEKWKAFLEENKYAKAV